MFDSIYMIDYWAILLTVATLICVSGFAGFVVYEVFYYFSTSLTRKLDKIRDTEYPIEKLDQKRSGFMKASLIYVIGSIISSVIVVLAMNTLVEKWLNIISFMSNGYYPMDVFTAYLICSSTMIYVFITLARRGELEEPLNTVLAGDFSIFKKGEGKPAVKLNSDEPTSSTSSQQVPNPPAKKGLLPDWAGMIANLTKKKDKPKVIPPDVKKKMELTEEESLIIQQKRLDEAKMKEALRRTGIDNNGS